MSRNKKPSTNITEDQTDAYIQTLMTAYGITDEDIDNLEKDQAEQDRLAYIKWRKFVDTFMAGNTPETSCQTAVTGG